MIAFQSKTSDIYRFKELWPLKIASNQLRANKTYSKALIDEDLQVFIPNTKMIEESIKNFVEMYSLRTRTSHEYWLVDIGYWTANAENKTGFHERIRDDLRNLQLDLDDDLYFFEGKTMLQ